MDTVEILKTIELKNTQGDLNLVRFFAATQYLTPSEVASLDSFIVGWFAATANEKDWEEAIRVGCQLLQKTRNV